MFQPSACVLCIQHCWLGSCDGMGAGSGADFAELGDFEPLDRCVFGF